MDNSDYADGICLKSVKNPIALENQFPDIVSVCCFWNLTLHFRESRQLLNRIKNAFDKLPSIKD